jgi:hypothetical protein
MGSGGFWLNLVSIGEKLEYYTFETCYQKSGILVKSSTEETEGKRA